VDVETRDDAEVTTRLAGVEVLHDSPITEGEEVDAARTIAGSSALADILMPRPGSSSGASFCSTFTTLTANV
jgi:hypothetical protein